VLNVGRKGGIRTWLISWIRSRYLATVDLSRARRQDAIETTVSRKRNLLQATRDVSLIIILIITHRDGCRGCIILVEPDTSDAALIQPQCVNNGITVSVSGDTSGRIKRCVLRSHTGCREKFKCSATKGAISGKNSYFVPGFFCDYFLIFRHQLHTFLAFW